MISLGLNLNIKHTFYVEWKAIPHRVSETYLGGGGLYWSNVTTKETRLHGENLQRHTLTCILGEGVGIIWPRRPH